MEWLLNLEGGGKNSKTSVFGMHTAVAVGALIVLRKRDGNNVLLFNFHTSHDRNHEVDVATYTVQHGYDASW